jgi:phosphatidylserine/phosphatidylglycerophosphate/cardiolipin synthase-like enzyme
MPQLLFVLLCSALSFAKFEVPGFELVVTTPVETGLANDDLRGPAEVWKELLDGAKRNLDLGQAYASGQTGEPLDEVLARLEAAGERGVKIRFLLDEKMLKASGEETLARLRKIPRLELRVLDFGKISAGGIMHAKYIVADGKRAFVGSQNFDWRSLKHIHETGLLISEPSIVKHVSQIFGADWKAWKQLSEGKRVITRFAYQEQSRARSARAYLVASPKAFLPPGVGDSEAELPRLIGEAKQEIRVQVLDYAPLRRDHSFYPVIDNALRAALARGVKVQLLVSHWNLAKPELAHLQSLSLLPGIEVRFAKLPMASAGPIPFARVNHSKFMTIDGGVAWVGTSNWTGGYLDKTRNLELVVKEPALAGRLNKLHAQLWDAPFTEKLDPVKDYEEPKKDGR